MGGWAGGWVGGRADGWMDGWLAEWLAVTVQFISNFPYNISMAYTISVQGGSEGFLSLAGLPASIRFQSGHEHCKVHLNKHSCNNHELPSSGPFGISSDK